MPSEKRRSGDIAEDIVALYLKTDGYEVIERNYLKKYGEIDIVARKRKKLYFIEVKSKYMRGLGGAVSCETWKFTKIEEDQDEQYSPELNVHREKRKRLARIIQIFLGNYKEKYDEFFIDIYSVYLYPDRCSADIKIIPNIILSE